MARRREPYTIEEFRGENNRDGLANQRVFGRRGLHKLARLRGYHLVGFGRALSRRGYKPFIAGSLNGNFPMQGLAMYEFGTTRHLVGVSNGKIGIKVGTAWVDITGSVVVATGQDVLIRWAYFYDGVDEWLLGSDGFNPIFGYKASGNAVAFTDNAIPSGVKDMKEFHGHLFGLGSTENEYRLEYSNYGTLDFSQNNLIDITADSRGQAIAKHSTNQLLVLFEREIHKLVFNPNDGPTFYALPVQAAEDEGCISRTSVITSEAHTYWASPKGMYRLTPTNRVEYIGHDIEDYWLNELDPDRRRYITGFVRGRPWNEIMWFATSRSSTEHDTVLVYNTQINAWSIFPRSSTAGKLRFNCATNWRDTDGEERSIVGGYDGIAYEAFGTAYVDSGIDDDGGAIETEFQTGLINFDYPGVSSMRQMLVDFEISDEKTFMCTFDANNNRSAISKTMKAGVSGDLLDVGFVLDESFLTENFPQRAKVKVDMSASYIQSKFALSNAGLPHAVIAVHFPHINKSMREI